MKLNERLKFLLDEKGLTMRDVSRSVGKNYRTVQSYVYGETEPDAHFFRALKTLIPDYNSNWLLFGDGNPFFIHPEQGPEGKPLREESASQSQHEPDGNLVGLKVAHSVATMSVTQGRSVEERLNFVEHAIRLICEKEGISLNNEDKRLRA